MGKGCERTSLVKRETNEVTEQFLSPEDAQEWVVLFH